MEGSFGMEKEYYGLTKIRAMTRKNEEPWIFFGVDTAKAPRLSRKMTFEKPERQLV